MSGEENNLIETLHSIFISAYPKYTIQRHINKKSPNHQNDAGDKNIQNILSITHRIVFIVYYSIVKHKPQYNTFDPYELSWVLQNYISVNLKTRDCIGRTKTLTNKLISLIFLVLTQYDLDKDTASVLFIDISKKLCSYLNDLSQFSDI